MESDEKFYFFSCGIYLCHHFHAIGPKRIRFYVILSGEQFSRNDTFLSDIWRIESGICIQIICDPISVIPVQNPGRNFKILDQSHRFFCNRRFDIVANVTGYDIQSIHLYRFF
jgi:hypothetical protein